jgi:hypothetical protein
MAGKRIHVLGATKSGPPTLAIATSLCVPAGDDQTIYQWNFIAPYLVCFISDANTGTSELFQQNTDGTYTLLSHGGGDMPVARLVSYGLKATTAQTLLSGLHYP